MVLRGPGLVKIDSSQLADFTEALRDSTIPFLVEARDWARLPERFHGEIEREYVVLVESEKGTRLFGENWKRMPLGNFVTLQRGHDLPMRSDGPETDQFLVHSVLPDGMTRRGPLVQV